MFKCFTKIFSILLITTPLHVNATELKDLITLKKEIICGPKEKIFKILTSVEAKERPIWAGHDVESKTTFALFENEKDKTFTIVQIADPLACVLGMGTMSQTLNQIKGKPISK